MVVDSNPVNKVSKATVSVENVNLKWGSETKSSSLSQESIEIDIKKKKRSKNRKE